MTSLQRPTEEREREGDRERGRRGRERIKKGKSETDHWKNANGGKKQQCKDEE